MSFLDYLDRVRAKPESERRRLVLIAASSLTLLIALLWLWNLKVVVLSSDDSVVTRQESGFIKRVEETAARIKLGWQTLIK